MLLPLLFLNRDYDFVKRIISQISSIVSKVVAPEDQDVFSLVRLQSLLKQVKPVVFQVLGFLKAQNLARRVILAIKPFLFSWLIVRHENVSKNLRVPLARYIAAARLIVILRLTGNSEVELRAPHEFKVARLSSKPVLLFVDSGKKHGFHAHFSKQGCICWRVAKGVKLPPYSRCDSKLELKEFSRHLKVSENVRITGRCFICWDQTSVDKFKLPAFHKAFDSVTVFILFQALIVSAKKPYITKSVSVSLVFLKFFENRVED